MLSRGLFVFFKLGEREWSVFLAEFIDYLIEGIKCFCDTHIPACIIGNDKAKKTSVSIYGIADSELGFFLGKKKRESSILCTKDAHYLHCFIGKMYHIYSQSPPKSSVTRENDCW